MYAICDTADIVADAVAGDQQAWDELVRRHRGRLMAIAAGFRLSGADADDAVQMTWLSLIQHVHTLRSHDRVGAWLSTTMRHSCLRILKRQRRETPFDSAESTAADASADMAEGLIRAERSRLLWQAVESLPARQARLVRALFADDERSYYEIASALSMPVGAIGPIRGRALRRLGQLLAESGTSPDELRLSA
ncbi:MAG TPA: sigma-70 family RNA polymerase sigma factor [Micromonosporaceae bacterium]|jgi:RNA polymerase sigma factor (sigma-70 family)